MLIVFGVRNVTAKSYEPAQFGLIDPSWNGTAIIAMVKYFHLMYIPFFPVGTQWALRQSDGKKYEMNYSVKQHVEQAGVQLKTPWWAFSGLILVGVILLVAAFS